MAESKIYLIIEKARKTLYALLAKYKIMSFKKWLRAKPYWLKGGITLGIISIVINGSLFLFCSINGIAGDWCFVTFLTTIPIIILTRLPFFMWLGLVHQSIFLLATVIAHFVIGALIGFLIDGIKSKK